MGVLQIFNSIISISCKFSQYIFKLQKNSLKFRNVFRKLFLHPQLFLIDCETSGDCPQYFLIKSFSEGISKFITRSSFLLVNNIPQTVKSMGLMSFNNLVSFWNISPTPKTWQSWKSCSLRRMKILWILIYPLRMSWSGITVDRH